MEYEESSQSVDISVSNETEFPHKFGFSKDLSSNVNNSFNAALHCLTNIEILSKNLIKKIENHPFIDLIIILGNAINERNDVNTKINNGLINYKDYIFKIIKEETTDSEIKLEDSRVIIDFALEDLKDNDYLPEELYSKLSKICKKCGKKDNFAEKNLLKIFKFEIPKIIGENTNLNINKINDKLTIYDCFDFYFKSLNREFNICKECNSENGVVVVEKLPGVIIICLYYGRDNDFYCERPYEIEENINFKNFDYLNEEDRKREYFLSSMIAGKNIGTKFEIFYTFSRGDENSKYIMYNGSEVRSNYKITNKLIKKKIDLKDKKQSWPFVLVYTEKNMKKE